MDKKRIVITGVGVLAPNGIGKEAFWQALKEGRSGIKPITTFDPSLFKTKLAGEISDFNPEGFLDAKGLKNLDRATKLVCSAAKLALEDAALEVTPDNTDEIGVVTGTTLSIIWDLAQFTKEVVQEGPQFASPVLFPGTTINSPSSHISIRCGIKGFNTTISTGYTAGLDALKYAVSFIKLERAKVVLIAGVDDLSFPNYAGFYKMGFLAGIKGEEISCPFDSRHNGIILGEGATVLIVEDEEYARERNARIYCEILSTECSFDAYRAAKYDPWARGLKKSMAKALESSHLGEEEIDYISAAANSVAQQDRLETQAIKEIFNIYAKRVCVSSIKSMLGESVSAAGVLQLASAIGAITEGFIPPTVNYQQPDPDCDLDYVVNESRVSRINNVLINTFGPGGSNASAILSRYH